MLIFGEVGEEGGGVAEVDAWSVVIYIVLCGGVGGIGGGIGGGNEGDCVEDLAHVDCGGGGGVGDYYAVEGGEGGEGV